MAAISAFAQARISFSSIVSLAWLSGLDDGVQGSRHNARFARKLDEVARRGFEALEAGHTEFGIALLGSAHEHGRVDVSVRLSEIHSARGDEKIAINILEKGFRSGDVASGLRLREILESLGRGVHYAALAEEIDAAEAPGRLAAARLLSKQGDNTGAIALLEPLSERKDETGDRAAGLLGMLLSAETSDRDIEALLRRGSSVERLAGIALAESLSARGATDQARIVLDQGFARWRETYTPPLARHLTAHGDPARAEEILRALGPGDKEGSWGLYLLCTHQQRWDEARFHYWAAHLAGSRDAARTYPPALPDDAAPDDVFGPASLIAGHIVGRYDGKARFFLDWMSEDGSTVHGELVVLRDEGERYTIVLDDDGSASIDNDRWFYLQTDGLIGLNNQAEWVIDVIDRIAEVGIISVSRARRLFSGFKAVLPTDESDAQRLRQDATLRVKDLIEPW